MRVVQVAWTPDEDKALLDGLDLHGKKWTEIVKTLPGRNVNQTRNRYLRLQEGQGRIGKNRCQWCRQTRNGHICLVKMIGGTTIDIAKPIIVGESPPSPVQPNPPPPPSPPLWLEPDATGQQADLDSRALGDVLQPLPAGRLQTPFVVSENEKGGSADGSASCVPDGCPPLASDDLLETLMADATPSPAEEDFGGWRPEVPSIPLIDRLNTQQLNKLLVDMCWPSDESNGSSTPKTTATMDDDELNAVAEPPPVVRMASSFEMALPLLPLEMEA